MAEGEKETHEGKKFIKIIRTPNIGYSGPLDSDDAGWMYTIGLEDEKGNSVGGLVPDGFKTKEEAEAGAKKAWGEGLEIRFEEGEELKK